MRNRSGATLLGLLVFVGIIALLGTVAVPKVGDLQRRAKAERLLESYEIIRGAVQGFYGDSGYFPRETEGGTVPENLAMYLPPAFAFKTSDWAIDYERWDLRDSARYVFSPVVVGVAYVSTDPRVAATAMELVRGNVARYAVGRRYTLMIFGL